MLCACAATVCIRRSRTANIVLVLRQSTMNHSGEIGVISYGDDEMTIKRINYVDGEDWLKLVPLNPAYPPRRIEGVDLESCHIIGIPQDADTGILRKGAIPHE